MTSPAETDASVHIRPEEPRDSAAVGDVIRVAFGDHGEDVVAIWAGLGRHRRAGLVAADGDDVIGHVGLSRSWIDARSSLVDTWMLSPLSVLPARERRGIGTALVAAAVETARASGIPALFLEGSPTYYGARGFEKASERGFLPASVRTPDSSFQVVLFDSYAAWMTGRQVYPSIWWEHDGAGLRDPDLAELEERFGRSQ